MAGFGVLNAEFHEEANKYIDKYPQLLTIWWTEEIKLIKKLLWDAVNEELLEGDDGIEEVSSLLKLWDWRELPESLGGDGRYYIFESLIMRVRPREYTQMTRNYISQHWDTFVNQFDKDGEILYLDEGVLGEIPNGITAKRVNHIFKIMEQEYFRNLRDNEGTIKFRKSNRMVQEKRGKAFKGVF